MLRKANLALIIPASGGGKEETPTQIPIKKALDNGEVEVRD
jgi:hypothetical protein